MNCHYTQNLISAFIDHELDSEEKRELRKHLISCAECNTEYQNLMRLKNCLENLAPVNCSFDAAISLRTRLTCETQEFLPSPLRLIFIGRISMVAAGLLLFFLSTSALFPSRTSSSNLANRRSVFLNPVAYDQNIAIDQSVTIYQASSILP